MGKKEKLTTEILKEQDKKYSEVKQITVLNDYYVNLRPNVSNKDVSNIFLEFGNLIQDKVVQHAMPDDENIVKYFMCCIVKNQTDLFENIEYERNNIGLYRVFRILLDSHAIDEIISYIDKKDLMLLYSKYNSVIEVGIKISKVEGFLDKFKIKKESIEKDDFEKETSDENEKTQ